MSIDKRIIDLSTRDLQHLQDAILAEIQRRKEIVTLDSPTESDEQPREAAQPAATPAPQPPRRRAA